MIGEKRLMVVADGALNYIPFEVLLKSADAGDFSSLGYLVKTNEVIYAPSASVVGAIKQQRTKATGRAMLIIADPVFNRTTRARRRARPFLRLATRKLAASEFRARLQTLAARRRPPPRVQRWKDSRSHG